MHSFHGHDIQSISCYFALRQTEEIRAGTARVSSVQPAAFMTVSCESTISGAVDPREQIRPCVSVLVMRTYEHGSTRPILRLTPSCPTPDPAPHHMQPPKLNACRCSS